MDIQSLNVCEVLNNLQKKIAFIFQDLMREKNNYKQNSENLNIKLKQLSAETEIIKKENEALREIYDEMKIIVYAGVRLFRNADFSGLNLKREHEIELENLKKKILDNARKLENFELTLGEVEVEVGHSLEETEKAPRLNVKRYIMNEAEIQKEFESIKELSFSTQFFNNEETDANGHDKEYVLNRSNADLVLKNVCERKHDNTCQSIKKVVRQSETFYLDYDDELPWNKSPVFKDFGSHKQEGILAEEPDVMEAISPPVKLVNEKFVEKSRNFIISPWKMSRQINENSPEKGSSTPKRARKKLEIGSPKRSTYSQLKKSNCREAEISASGVRKLTQTLLNIECYKQKGLEDWKSCENAENKKKFEITNDVIKCERTVIVDPEEDDFIIESPKKTDQLPEDIKSRSSNENALNDQLITPPETSEADLDETYISSSIIRKCNLPKKHLLEKIEERSEERTSLKRPAREESPEYDSVPFVYKRLPVRKRAERMKLPGHACLECNKYYENALGKIGTQDFRKILNTCSRHRDKNSPSHDETPPGYWKPYLTCSLMASHKQDNP